MSNYSSNRTQGKVLISNNETLAMLLKPKMYVIISLFQFIIFILEILFNSPRISQSLYELRRNQLVPLANRCSGSLRSIPNLRGLRLSSKCFLYRHRQQGNFNPEHFQAILFEVGLQGYVLERV